MEGEGRLPKRAMIVLESHIVEKVTEPIRFVDYVIGVFDSVSSRNAVKKGIKRGEIILNGKEPTTGTWLKNGDVIQRVDPEQSTPKEYSLEVDILFEDDFIAIVNKPSGVLSSGNSFQTIENALIRKLKPSTQLDALKWGRVAHRLDRMTSGVIVLAKTKNALVQMKSLFEGQKVSKEYTAVLAGKLEGEKKITSPINDQPAESTFVPVEIRNSLNHEKITLARLIPVTGRTHQLRIHAASIGLPIVGDVLYGEKGNTLLHKGLFLCASNIEFVHPFTEKLIQIGVNYPTKFDKLMEREERRWLKYRSI